MSYGSWDFSKEEWLNILLRKREEWTVVRAQMLEEKPGVLLDLRGVNLRGANLVGANLQYLDLRDADLTGADLRKARLKGTLLEGVILTGTRLNALYHIRGTTYQDSYSSESSSRVHRLKGRASTGMGKRAPSSGFRRRLSASPRTHKRAKFLKGKSLTSRTKNTKTVSSIDQRHIEKIVRVWFGTDRAVANTNEASEYFDNERGNGELCFGHCDVSIPPGHKMGELESPRWWRLEFRENPSKHVVLRKVIEQERDAFFRDINEQETNSSFVFVHGYNVSFEDAARRTAQMANDLGIQAVPLFYSWPSRADVKKYTVDEANIKWTQSNLEKFLEELFDQTNMQKIHLIAHSMGNRAMTQALGDLLAKRPELRSRLHAVILSAPDIDADVFRRNIAPKLVAEETSITLYASSEDLALEASKKLHGYPRAGDSGDGLVVINGIETIDATGMDTGFLKHSYFAGVRTLISDIHGILKGEPPAERHGLEVADSPQGPYWKFRE